MSFKLCWSEDSSWDGSEVSVELKGCLKGEKENFMEGDLGMGGIISEDSLKIKVLILWFSVEVWG